MSTKRRNNRKSKVHPKPARIHKASNRSLGGFRVGDKVCDKWWWWRVGSIIEIKKTVLRVRFPSNTITTYDVDHLQFLEKI